MIGESQDLEKEGRKKFDSRSNQSRWTFLGKEYFSFKKKEEKQKENEVAVW